MQARPSPRLSFGRSSHSHQTAFGAEACRPSPTGERSSPRKRAKTGNRASRQSRIINGHAESKSAFRPTLASPFLPEEAMSQSVKSHQPAGPEPMGRKQMHIGWLANSLFFLCAGQRSGAAPQCRHRLCAARLGTRKQFQHQIATSA